MAQTVGDYRLARLRDWGVEHVFAYPGDGINGIVAAFGKADNQPRFVQARHEEMAAFAAVGYASRPDWTGRPARGAGVVAAGRDHRCRHREGLAG